MIQAISNSLSQDDKYYQLKLQKLADATSSIDGSSTTAEQNVALPQAVMLKTDQVEISDAGRNALAVSKELPSAVTEQISNAASITQSDISTSAAQINISSPAAQSGDGVPPTVQSSSSSSKTQNSSSVEQSSISTLATQMAEETSSAETVTTATTTSSSDLSSLTESQIQQLVSDNTITKAQADAEISRRQQKSEPPKENAQAVNAYQKMALKDPLQMNQTGSLVDEVA